MTVRLDFSPQMEARIKSQAAAQGLPLDAYLQFLIEQAAADAAPSDPTLALFRQWEAEDATNDPQEIESRNREWKELESRLSASRVYLPTGRK